MNKENLIQLLQDHLGENHKGLINENFSKEAEGLIRKIKDKNESNLQGLDYTHFCLKLDKWLEEFIG